MNNLIETLNRLIDVRDTLYATINDATRAHEVRLAALGEFDEVALRIRTLLARDLQQQVTGLDSMVTKVTDTHNDLKQVLAGAKRAADIVKSVSTFLGIVDKLLDELKLVLPLL
jgi:hypothetical protein